MQRQTERKTRSHSLVLSPWCRVNSWWILSTPAALFWFDAFKNGLDLLGREVAREVKVSAWGMSEVSHHRGDVSGEILVRIGECPIADGLSSDEICCYVAYR